MNITNKYIVKTIMKPVASAIAIGLLLLMAARLVRILDITLGKKDSLGIVFEMLAYLVPHYLGLALPAALFLGLLIGFNNLSKSSEIDAFMAVGTGLHQLVQPLMLIAAVFTLAALLIVGWFQPHARHAYRAIVHSVKNVEIYYLAEEGVFMQTGKRTFILDKLSRGTNQFERLFLFENNKTRGSLTLTSRRGALLYPKGDPRPILRLHEGHRLRIDGDAASLASDQPLPPHAVGEFDEVDTALGKVTNNKFRARGLGHRELTLPELVKLQANPPKKTTRENMIGELHKRIVAILSIMILPVLAIPFAMGRRRGHRAYRFTAAMIILVIYHETTEQGAIAVQIGKASVWVALWLPFAVLLSFSLWQFYVTSFTVKRDRLEPVLEWCVDRILRSKNKLLDRANHT